VTKIALLLLLVLGPLPARSEVEKSPAGPSREARNKAVAGRVFEEIFNQGRFQVADEIYAPDFRNHGLHRDIELREDQAAVHDEKSAFPDLRMSVDMMVAEGELVTVVWTFRGTHTGPGYGIPPTGAKVDLRGITVWRIIDGRIRDEWTAFEYLDVVTQILSRVKWLLIGASFAAVILVWALFKGVRRLRRRREAS
jgi:steroid delta-isomerase-like uncharacterized protein